jgi:tetratricopeptide (TPR) repeat protein
MFRRATELDPEQIFTNPRAEATRLSAEGLRVEAGRLARNGEVERAVATFRKARERDANLNLDPEAEAKSLAAKALVERGDGQAHQGNLDEAVALLTRAKELDPSLDFDPKQKPKKGVAGSLVGKGQRLATRGRIEEAVAAFQQARTLDPERAITAEAWNVLCWNGSLWGYPEKVLSACDQAVAANSEGVESAGPRYSRGVARALLRDRAGAIEDLRSFVELSRYLEISDEVVAQRRAWIRALERGQDPITPEVIAVIRQK